jgi:hypothetical protein
MLELRRVRKRVFFLVSDPATGSHDFDTERRTVNDTAETSALLKTDKDKDKNKYGLVKGEVVDDKWFIGRVCKPS